MNRPSNIVPLHRGVVRPATNDQGMIESIWKGMIDADGEPELAEARDWSLLFFAGLVGFALGLLATAGMAWMLAGFVL